MTATTISPLRQRMIEDMTVRGFATATKRGYIAVVRDFAIFLGRSPDAAEIEDLRRYQLHMRTVGASSTSMNAAVSALRFFFGVTLGRGDANVGMTTVREPHRLPVVLSPDEVERLLNAASGLKYRAALSIAYGAGLRASEVVSLRISDIDSQREVIRVEQGIRHYGLFANAIRANNLERLRELLGVVAQQRESQTDDAAVNDNEPQTLTQPCPCCGGRMIIIETFERGAQPRVQPQAQPGAQPGAPPRQQIRTKTL